MHKKLFVLTLAALVAHGLVFEAKAGVKLEISKETFADFGVKGLLWTQLSEDAAPDGESYSLDFPLRQARIYMSGQITSLEKFIVKFGTNFDFGVGKWDGGIKTHDGLVRDFFVNPDFMHEFKVQVGLYRISFSRQALTDTYQFIQVHGPFTAGGNQATTGDYRHLGLTAWGNMAGGLVQYRLGVYDGDLRTSQMIENDLKDSPQLVARLSVSLLKDKEKGYVYPQTYFGKKKVATLGFGYTFKKYDSAPKEKIAETTYNAFTVDGFAEYPIASGALTGEAAYFNYDRGDVENPKTKALYIMAGYLLPWKIGPGQPGLAARYEYSNRDGTITGGDDYKALALGLNYYIQGHNAKGMLEYQKKDYDAEGNKPRTDKDYSDLTLQLQVQF